MMIFVAFLLYLLPMVSPEAFSSTAHLKLLVSAEKDMTDVLKMYIEAEVQRLESIKMYVYIYINQYVC